MRQLTLIRTTCLLKKTFVIFFVCLMFTGCTFSGNSNTQISPIITVATEPTFPPFEFQSSTGKLEGFDIDLMRAIGNAGGFEVKFQSLPFDGIIPALQTSTVDAAISAISITKERLNTISFSRPYFKAGLAIAVRNNNNKIINLDSLKNQEIAVQIGTTGAETAKTISGAKIRTFDSAPLALQELINGNVEAVINDAPVTLYAIKTGNIKGIKVGTQLLTEEYYGIATGKNSRNLTRINEGLKKVLETGTYSQIYQKWFNSLPPDLPISLPFSESPAKKSTFFSVFISSLPLLFQGALITLQLTGLSVFFGIIGGCLIGIGRLSSYRPLSFLARVYIDFFRGTPLLVQIFMIYFGLPALIQEFGVTFNLERLPAAVLALSLNSSAYIAEIMRAGIQSIERGQTEAAISLGLGPVQTLRFIILPQVFRRMLPALGNEFITLLKDTSLVAVIGFEELFRRGQLIVAENYRSFEIYSMVALVYLALTLLSSQAFTRLEIWMNPVKQKKMDD